MTKKFYKMTIEERKEAIKNKYGRLFEVHLSDESSDKMIENYVTQYQVPLGLAQNFIINKTPYQIPMATEEPSVIAAASNGAKILGNIHSLVLSNEMIGELVFDKDDAIENYFQEHFLKLKEIADLAHPNIVKRGGGLRRFEVNHTPSYTIVKAIIQTKEAMGANIVNTIMEGMGTYLEENFQKSYLHILSNLALYSLTQASVSIEMDPEQGQAIERLNHIATEDVYRATTHNKGIMNGISALVLATGNDTRAVEAGAHAFASLSGQYQPLTQWKYMDGHLSGTILLPINIGSVGGTIRNHPVAQDSLKILGNPTKETLMCIMAAVGLAQNFAALKALSSDGIQKGHMKLQARAIVSAIKAPQQYHQEIINTMIKQKKYSESFALELLHQLQTKDLV